MCCSFNLFRVLETFFCEGETSKAHTKETGFIGVPSDLFALFPNEPAQWYK